MKRIPLWVGLGIALGGVFLATGRGPSRSSAADGMVTSTPEPIRFAGAEAQREVMPHPIPEGGAPQRSVFDEDARRRAAFEAAMASFMEWFESRGSPQGWERYWREEEQRWSRFVEEMKEKDPRVEDYPFLDPIADAPSDPTYYGTFSQILGFEQSSVRNGYWWEDIFPGVPSERLKAPSKTLLERYDLLAGFSPLQIASMPWFGDVPKERIVENLELLAALRMEYLDDALPLLDQRNKLQGWQGLARTLPSRLPEGARGDFDDLIDERIREIEAQLEPLRARYLRALGEAIGATELPPID